MVTGQKGSTCLLTRVLGPVVEKTLHWLGWMKPSKLVRKAFLLQSIPTYMMSTKRSPSGCLLLGGTPTWWLKGSTFTKTSHPKLLIWASLSSPAQSSTSWWLEWTFSPKNPKKPKKPSRGWPAQPRQRPFFSALGPVENPDGFRAGGTATAMPCSMSRTNFLRPPRARGSR